MFKTKLRVVFVFFVLLIASALIANHFTGRVFNYSDPIGEVKRIYNYLASQIVTEPLSTKRPEKVSTTTLQHTLVSADNHLSQVNNTRCVDVSLGEVKYKRNGDIFTWTDSEGVPHFSDKKPDFAVATYNPGFVESLDYFDLTLNTPNLPSSFNQELHIKLNTVFKAYGQVIGVHALKKVKLNLTVLATRSAYESAIKHRGGDPKNTAGMYFHGSNSAFIHYDNGQSAMRTSVHEAVHAINKAVLGYTPRWLNEGFAEYFELTKNNMQTGIVEPNRSWTKNNNITKSVFTINWLIGLEDTWRKGDNSKLYASSWAAIYFLMDTQAGRALLKNIMLTEQQSPCSKLSAKKLKKMLYTQLPNLKREYSQWLKMPFRAHNF
ncbi:DUF1570 domain-containing protein [Pseudoalteromonas sp. SCSIO 43210]|uniref:DUF1570 domain-containing protein n=1 Tax=Pseudoalteromonas sp. Bsw20308 TaxID=283699 RepID=UPI0002AAA927|nr:DUF1570 domain-containing protein [Pseudoalteromonas sp. Bsw20308]ALQ10510.1 hypothetical protein D172_020830 [Pseudoalteromonas sp. Bsw20308]